MTTEAKTSNTIQVVRKMVKEKRARKNPGAGQTIQLHYEFIESETGGQVLNDAYDILFREAFKGTVEKRN